MHVENKLDISDNRCQNRTYVLGFIGPNKIQFQSLDEFTLEDLESKSTLFSTKSQTWTNVENPGINLHVPSLSTAHVS